MIPIWYCDVTLRIDTGSCQGAYWGERGRGGQAKGYMEGME